MPEKWLGSGTGIVNRSAARHENGSAARHGNREPIGGEVRHNNAVGEGAQQHASQLPDETLLLDELPGCPMPYIRPRAELQPQHAQIVDVVDV